MPATNPPQTVEVHGFALREIRQRAGLLPRDLAAALDCDRSYIARLETGHARRVSATFYARLLNELGIKDHRALLAVAPAREAA